MTLSHWLIYILSQRRVTEGYTRCDNAAFSHFVTAISGTNSNQFEFVRQIAAEKFCRSDKDFHITSPCHTSRLVAATCRLVCLGL